MTSLAVLRPLAFFSLALLLAWPLGGYMARVFAGQRTWLHPLLQPLERAIYRLGGIDPDAEMTWQAYAAAVLGVSAAGVVLLYALQRLQGVLPLNPRHLPAVPPWLAFNTAVSFVGNTNWQAYSGEQTMSHLTQMAGLTVQNFLSAGTGLAVAIAFVRGLTRRESTTLGNFWADLTRSVVYVLLPISLVLALALVSQGVVQTLRGEVHVTALDRAAARAGQTIPLGPAASQVAIKVLGTNGGGFFGANSAHPLENPTPLSDWLQMLALLAIPLALPFTFGQLAKDPRQGVTVLAAMLVILLASLAVTTAAEMRGNPLLARAGADLHPSATQAGGNMEGKEVRFGPAESALYATVTTGTSTGSVNSSHDSFTPLGGLMPLWLMQLGEVAPGGVGSGLYGMLIFVLIAVFIAGLMVGRTPEYLGKKIEPYEMKMAVLYFLIMPMVVLTLTALALVLPAGKAGIAAGGPHGLSQVLYALTSAVNNNGSAFGGLNAALPFYEVLVGVAILIGRFWMIIPVLAIAGSLARKKAVPVSAGTLPTHGLLFTGWVVAVVIIAGALNFFPALALGPIVEQILLGQGRVF